MLERAINCVKRCIENGATAITLEKEIVKASTQDEVIELARKLPWSKLDRLRWRCWSLQHTCVKGGNYDGANDWVNIEFNVIIPIKMTRIIEDPRAPKDKKREAVEYAKAYGEENLKVAFTPPDPNEKRATVITNTGPSYSDISLVVSKYVSLLKKG